MIPGARSTLAAFVAFSAFFLGCGAVPPRAPAAPPTAVRVAPQIVSPTTDGTPRELFVRGERALVAQRWREAADAFETLLASRPDGADAELVPAATFDLATAYEGLELREKARDRYHEVAARWPATALARTSLVRALGVHAYLEEWPGLSSTAAELLARPDLDKVDRLTALGAQGLARIEQGDDRGASKDVQDGLDLVEELHYGEGGRLPVAAAQLQFALGEIRRVRSEKIQFVPKEIPAAQAVPPDFLPKMEARCQGLLDAQSAYGTAMRSVDPHWIAMAGYRVGEMYRTLHHDLMVVPPTLLAKSGSDKQLFYAMMHVRYRVLLEKGRDMMERTLVLGEQQLDSSAWVNRAKEAKRDIDQAIDEEKAILKSFPFTEEEVQKALDILRKKAEKEAERRSR